MGLVEPCISSTASDAVAGEVQFPRSAAHDGTDGGVGSGLGSGVGVGVGVGVGLGVGVGVVRTALGLEWGARGPFAVQPEIDASTARRTTPYLTWG
jgi:hypothetical protein